MISYGNKTTKGKFDLLKQAARDDLRKFSSNKAQRSCGVQPLSSVRVYKLGGRYRHDSAIPCKICNSCPWCSIPRLAAHRTQINAMAVHALDLGGFVLKATFTLPKRNAKDLNYSYEVLMAQIARFRRKVRPLEFEFNITRSVRTLEETYSDKTFWHPHVNWLWFIHEPMNKDSLAELEEKLLNAWLESASLGGIRGLQIAAQRFNAYYTDEAVRFQARYVTKQSYYPEQVPNKQLDGYYHGLQPWHILELARTGELKWIVVFRQYEKAMKRRRRVVFYKNLPS